MYRIISLLKAYSFFAQNTINFYVITFLLHDFAHKCNFLSNLPETPEIIWCIWKINRKLFSYLIHPLLSSGENDRDTLYEFRSILQPWISIVICLKKNNVDVMFQMLSLKFVFAIRNSLRFRYFFRNLYETFFFWKYKFLLKK